MIFVDESTVKVGKVVLPGLFKSLEIKEDARVEEQEIEGKAARPKQATGYEDAKVTLELILEDGPKLTKLQKLAVIQKLFRKPGQTRPVMHTIINEHTAARGISKVIFKNLVTKEQSKNSAMIVSIEFWQYGTVKIVASKKSSKKKNEKSSSASSGSGSGISLNANYQNYLDTGSRGTAPKLSKTAAADIPPPASTNQKLAALTF
ncbi:hypothetical protein J6TS7_02840 [Paenibacillus dendritiformis]|uniref:transcriptional regulator n=1 Tax=Paenibacillus TaxID=44249 RepID=UPI001B1E761A|nr:transcriptional regulator [Paenibacillus dendritiformis]GIO76674.1 hypothetical protein J6TS7_02840 [Paenibacillus dendritiformis]